MPPVRRFAGTAARQWRSADAQLEVDEGSARAGSMTLGSFTGQFPRPWLFRMAAHSSWEQNT
eukprot:15242555-Alexandrium_andersonii.AAC.1